MTFSCQYSACALGSGTSTDLVTGLSTPLLHPHTVAQKCVVLAETSRLLFLSGEATLHFITSVFRRGEDCLSFNLQSLRKLEVKPQSVVEQ